MEADPLEIRLIFLNILKNAFEAAVTGSVPPLVTVALLDEDSTWIVTVKDTGPAVPDDVFERLSIPLNTTKTEGLGFGLVIVRGLLAQMGGTLTLSRTETQSVCARIALPKAVAAPPTTPDSETSHE